jgi:formylglycine-generating enzyme required for sulfatase activity
MVIVTASTDGAVIRIMYCERCNIDFPDGLRYCKWCGQTLLTRARSTSELHTCPTCSAAVQPGWVFCKSCGARLTSAVHEPAATVCPRCGAAAISGLLSCKKCGEDLTRGRPSVAVRRADAATTAVSQCSACSEPLDTGSLYCKSCGAAVYAEQQPFGGSALLCSACKSYSPLGSVLCRVCGTPLGETQKTEDKPGTLPDLLEHLPEAQRAALLAQEGQSGNNGEGANADSDTPSGANTLVLNSGSNQQGTMPIRSVPEGPAAARETNVLPGVGGSKSEKQAPTKAVKPHRITEPVHSEPRPPTRAEKPAQTARNEQAPTGKTPPPLEIVSASLENEPAGTSVFSSNQPSQPAGFQPDAAEPRNPAADHRDARTAPFGFDKEKGAPPKPPVAKAPSPSAPPSVANAPTQPAAGAPPKVSDADRRAAALMSAAAASLSDHHRSVPGVADHAMVPPAVAPTRRGSSARILSIISVVLVLGLGVSFVWWFVSRSGRPTVHIDAPPVQTTNPADTTSTTTKPPAPAVPEGMVPIPKGTYTIGRDDADPIEGPAHTVELAPFFMDRFEVTNLEYWKFVEATHHKPPANWKGGIYPSGKDNSPVTSVTWQDASDYAKWVLKRLPTEAEWEAAARGTEHYRYPWGNEWQPGFANIGLKTGEKVEADTYPSGISDVGRYPQGASPAGVQDMIGNVWEWVASEFAVYPGSNHTLTFKNLDEAGKLYRVIRGGAYDGDGEKTHDASYRGYLDGGLPYPKVGFRCVKDAQ